MIKLQRCATAAAIAVPLWMITSPAGAGDVIETMQEVSSSGQFEIDAFATAVEAAGLAEVLEGAGPHTIFAPTNEAFQMLEVGGLEPQGSAETPEEQLQSADKDRLSELLKHYIVEGRMTLQGTKLDVSAAKGGVLVNKIEVLKPDIMADNGVIHVIGGLLTPETASQTGTEQQR
ncbi:MAG: Nex18 symbiotically induced protein [Geminicoccaceae bacterium]|nr:Nex18 symbiotically induced protein [Geminicoccaceae bacterium]